VAAPKQAFWGARERRAALSHAPAAEGGAPVDPRVLAYLRRLAAHRLALVPMGGDGNCLFRSVADQVYGDQELHAVVRGAAASYMRLEAAFFRPFVVDADGAGWGAYLDNIARAGAWGDDPEVQALSEIYARPVEIWAYDPAEGAKRLRVFNSGAGGGGGESGGGGGGAAAAPPPIRLSYFGGGHYDSVRPLQAEWAAGALGSPLLPADAAGRFEEGVLRAAEERGRLAAAAPGAFQQALASSAAESEAAALGEALRQSREQFERAEYGNLELALTRSLAAEGGGGGGGAPPPPPPPPPPLPRPPPGAASVEQQILRQTIEQSALEADQKTLEDQQMEAALAESRRMQDAADVAAEKAAAQLSEDEQLECAVRGITAAQFLAEKAAAAGGGGGCAAAGAAGLPLFDLSALGGGGGKGRKR
jgi:OTU domain-containing protein 5